MTGYSRKSIALFVIAICLIAVSLTYIFTSALSNDSQFIEGELIDFQHIKGNQYQINLSNITTTIKIPGEYFFSFTIGNYYIIKLSSSNVIDNIIEIEKEK